MEGLVGLIRDLSLHPKNNRKPLTGFEWDWLSKVKEREVLE